MNKTSLASLQERLSDWTDWDITMYHIGACLGFWPEFGAPYDFDPWHGTKYIMWSNNPLGNAIGNFMIQLVKIGCLLENEDISYRWNPEYKGLE